MLAGDCRPLMEYEKLGNDAKLSIPTPEHYLPLLYVIGTQQSGEPTMFPIAGIDGGSISMLAVQIGQPTTSTLQDDPENSADNDVHSKPAIFFHLPSVTCRTIKRPKSAWLKYKCAAEPRLCFLRGAEVGFAIDHPAELPV